MNCLRLLHLHSQETAGFGTRACDGQCAEDVHMLGSVAHVLGSAEDLLWHGQFTPESEISGFLHAEEQTGISSAPIETNTQESLAVELDAPDLDAAFIRSAWLAMDAAMASLDEIRYDARNCEKPA